MKVGMVSLGCPKNLVDSEVMLGLAQQAGLELTREPEQAEVLIVNTCAFIESARQESIETIIDLADTKRPNARLVVIGCMAQRYETELRSALPEADAVVGLDRYPELVAPWTGSSNGTR